MCLYMHLIKQKKKEESYLTAFKGVNTYLSMWSFNENYFYVGGNFICRCCWDLVQNMAEF